MEDPVAGGANRNGPVWIFIDHQTTTTELTPGDPSTTSERSGITSAWIDRVVKNHRDLMHRSKDSFPYPTPAISVLDDNISNDHSSLCTYTCTLAITGSISAPYA